MLYSKELLGNMTLVLGIKTNDGFLLSADSQGIEHDGSVVKTVPTDSIKIYPLTDKLLVGVSGANLPLRIYEDYASGLKQAFDLCGVTDISVIIRESDKRVKEVTKRYPDAGYKFIIAGFATHGSNKLKPFMYTLEVNKEPERIAEPCKGVGIEYVFEHDVKLLKELDALPKSFSEENAQRLTGDVFNHVRGEEKRLLEEMKPYISGVVHIGGSIIQYRLTVTGYELIDSGLSYPPLVNPEDKIKKV